MNKKVKLLITFGIFFGVIGTLIYTSISNAATFYMTVDELKTNKEDVIGKPIKVSGKIVGDSIQFDPNNIVLTFNIRGEDDTTYSVPIHYKGAKPDSLNDGW